MAVPTPQQNALVWLGNSTLTTVTTAGNSVVNIPEGLYFVTLVNGSLLSLTSVATGAKYVGVNSAAVLAVHQPS